MASKRMGLGAVLRAAFASPTELFEAYQAGRVEIRPVLIFAASVFSQGLGVGVMIGAAAGQSVAGLGLAFGLLGLALTPLIWFWDVCVVHLAARVLGGRGGWHETRAAIGLSAGAQLLAGVPYLGTVLVLWSYVVRGIGLKILHGLKPWRAVVVLLMPLATSVLIAFSVRAFWLEAFKMPSGSMIPSLEIGDHMFVKKYAYGLFSRTLPRRGDVVVFIYPAPAGEPRVDYVKRVIGLPGDELLFKSGAPFINGWEVPRCSLGKATELEPEGHAADFDVFVEFLSGQAYLVALDQEHDEGVQGPYTVLKDEFWVVGDNRNNSSDSRAWAHGKGAGVPLDNLKGKAAWLWLPPERFGVSVHDRPVLPASMKSLQPKLDKCLSHPPDLEHQAPPPPKQAL